MRQYDRSPSEKLFWPVVWAVGLHAMLFAFLFVSFARTPDLPPARPIIKATLYQLQSQSQATTQTNQKIAGEAAKTSAPSYEVEQLEQKKVEQEKIAAAAQAAKVKSTAEAKAAEASKQAEQKAAQAQKQAQASKEDQVKKAAEKLKQAEVAKLKAADDAKKKAAEDAKKKAAEEAKKKAAAAEAAKKKAADDAKKKADDDKKKRAAEEAGKQKKAQEAARKALEDKKAGALAELLSEDTQYQQTVADTVGSNTSGSYDDLIRIRAAEGWTRPPGTSSNMRVSLQINMLPDGTITSVSVAQSSGNSAFDNSAVAAVKNIGRLVEMQKLSAADFNPYRSFKMTFTPEDLAF